MSEDSQAVVAPVEASVRPLSFDDWLAANERRMHCGHYSHEECMRAAWSGAMEQAAVEFDRRDSGSGGFYDPHEPAEIIRALALGERAA